MTTLRNITSMLLAFFLRQGVVQGLSLCFVILLGHVLDVQNYAIYTAAITIQNGMMLLASGAVGNYFSGCCYRRQIFPPQALIMLCIRRSAQILAAVSVVTSVFFLHLLSKLSIATSDAAILFTIVCLTAFSEICIKYLNVILLACREVGRWQTYEAATGLLKIVPIAAFGWLLKLTTANILGFLLLASLIRLLLQALDIVRNERWPTSEIKPTANYAPMQQGLNNSILRQMPTDFFHAAHPQFLIWLLANKADAAVLAGFGLLTRLAQFLAPINSMLSAHVYPQLCPTGRLSLWRLLYLATSLLVMSIVVIVAGIAFRGPLVHLLGGDINTLADAVPYALIFVCAYFSLNSIWSGLLANGFNSSSWLHIPATTILTGIAFLCIPLRSVSDVFIFQLICCTAIILPVSMEIREAVRD